MNVEAQTRETCSMKTLWSFCSSDFVSELQQSQELSNLLGGLQSNLLSKRSFFLGGGNPPQTLSLLERDYVPGGLGVLKPPSSISVCYWVSMGSGGACFRLWINIDILVLASKHSTAHAPAQAQLNWLRFGSYSIGTVRTSVKQASCRATLSWDGKRGTHWTSVHFPGLVRLWGALSFLPRHQGGRQERAFELRHRHRH